MKKLYFQKSDENCYSKEYHLEYMQENNIQQMELFESKVETGNGMFFCKHFFEIGEVNGTCGKICEAYAPRNGKNGRCRHSGHTYEQTEKSIILKAPEI